MTAKKPEVVLSKLLDMKATALRLVTYSVHVIPQCYNRNWKQPSSWAGGALCESSVIPFLVPRRKVWLTPAAGVPCSNAANIEEGKTWTQSEFCTWQNSVRGQEPRKKIYSVPAQETAKHRAKFDWPPMSDIAAVTKPRRETR